MGDYFYPFWNENSSKITVSKNLLLIMVSVIIKANIKLVLSIYPTLSQIFYVYCSVVPHKNSMGQMLSSPHCTGETTEVQKCLHVPGRERGNSSSVTQLISGAAKTLTQGDGLQDPLFDCSIRAIACHVSKLKNSSLCQRLILAVRKDIRGAQLATPPYTS